MFDKRSRIPIEQRNYSKYYVVFSGLLFLGTMWAVVDEVVTRRPWKEYQKTFYSMADSLLQQRIDQSVSQVDSAALNDAKAELKAAMDSLGGSTYAGLMKSFNRVSEQLIDATQDYQFAKSRGDEAYYFYKKSLHEGKPDDGQKRKLDENLAEMAKHQTVMDALQGRKDSLNALLGVYRQNEKKARNSIANILKSVEKYQTKMRRFASSTLQIKQVMLLDYDRNPFNDPKARIDRCQTCHLGWNEDVMEGAPEPYAKHPLPELLAAHNPETFGCTPCHRGQGPALTAGTAHGPADQYWDDPILKGKDVWASCNECHENESALAYAPEFTHAKQLMMESGCHGCHEIKGYTDLPKIGPQLGNISFKTSPTWIYNWVKNPKDYNAHTRMPNFKLSDEDAEAITAYLVDASSKSTFAFASQKGAYAGGSAERGKQLFETVGCQACHVLGGMTKVRDTRGTSYDIAPELTRVGSKVNPDWIFDWVRNPRHYNPTTKMPNLRLSDPEARDITAFLMTWKDSRNISSRKLDLSSADVIKHGDKLIREWGCSGCHVIPGMEKESRVSVSLSNFGRKRVEEMDFGDTQVHHTWHDWVFNKLKNSRVFATDRIIQKMPIFAFSDDEITSLRMFLLSETKDEPDKRYIRAFDKRKRDIETGRRVTIMYNCQQCHQLEKKGAYITSIIEDAAFQPPIITGEGKKVQEQWLYNFLSHPSTVGNPNSIRPWIPTRMPTFGFSEDEINKIQRYFLGLSSQEFELRNYAGYRPDPDLLPVGRKILTDFQCLKCHPAGNAAPKPGEATDLAPNLTKARDRLKPEWIVEWLADPGKLQEGTRMPTFFPDGQSPLPDVLGGDAKKQMMAIRDYVISIGQPTRSTVASK